MRYSLEANFNSPFPPEGALPGNDRVWFYKRGRPGEIARLADTIATGGISKLSVAELQQIIQGIYEQLPVVQERTAKRFKELGIRNTKPLTINNLHVVSEAEWIRTGDKVYKQKSHPALQALNHLIAQQYPEELEPAGGMTIGDDIYLNVEQISEDYESLEEDDITILLDHAADIMDYEETHRQCRRRRLEGDLRRATAEALQLQAMWEFNPAPNKFSKEETPVVNRYLRTLKKLIDSDQYTVEIRGARIFLQDVRGRILCDGGEGLDETITHNEENRRTFGSGWEKAAGNPSWILSQSPDIQLFMELNIEYYRYVKKLAEKVGGMNRLMKAYYTGEIYESLLAKEPKGIPWILSLRELLSYQFNRNRIDLSEWKGKNL